MSALGHKRTFCDAGAMSALPPKADIRRQSLECPLSANQASDAEIQSAAVMLSANRAGTKRQEKH